MNGKAARRRREALRRRQAEYREAGAGISQTRDRYGRPTLRVVIEREPSLAVATVVELRRWLLDCAEPYVIARMLAEGATWSDVGFVYDITPQGAHARWATAVDALLAEWDAGSVAEL